MKHAMRTLLFITLWVAVSASMQAQHNLQIATVFEKYGKSKGATMVEMNKEMLEAYEMTLYKSLMIRTPSPQIKSYILECIAADKKRAKKIKEVVENSTLLSGYYQLPQEKQDVNRFILYKESKKKVVTLIYIEGELDADDLITMLFMKQNN